MLLNIGITLVMIFLICYLGPKVLGFFAPFLIGWVISMIANPLVRFLERKLKIVRKHSSVLIIIGALALVVLGGYFLISRTVNEMIRFLSDLPDMYASLQEEFIGIGGKYERLFALLPLQLRNGLNSLSTQIGVYMSDFMGTMGMPTMEAAGSVARNIPNIFVQIVVTILSAYFFIAHRERIVDTFRRITPNSILKQYDSLYAQMKRLIGGYFAAQFKIMGVVALILLVGFVFLGVRYAVVLAALISILDFLPFFGTGTALIPWAVVDFLSGDYKTAIGLIVIYLISQVVRQVIQPKIVGDSMGLDPLATLFFMYIGFKVKGIAGMILAVPVGVIVIELFNAGVFTPLIEGVKEIVNDINEYRKL